MKPEKAYVVGELGLGGQEKITRKNKKLLLR